MTKFFNSCFLNIVNEKVKNTNRAIEIILYIFRILIVLIKIYPEIKEEINKKV